MQIRWKSSVQGHSQAEEVRAMRMRILASLAVFMVIGYALKFYRGPGDEWVNTMGPASIPYEIILILTAFFFAPRYENVLPIAIGVCIVTCLLEFLQLYTPPWLQAIRGTFLGRALLGNTFSWWDLPAYPVGCLAGYWYLLWLLKFREPGDSQAREG